MAEETGQERTEQPTLKRLADARKKGQVPRSRELNTFAVLIAGSSMMLLFGERMGQGLWEMMRTLFFVSREAVFDPATPVIYFRRAMTDGLMLIAPFLAIMVVVALLSPLALGGWAFSFEAMQPKLEKLDPIKGLGRLFALRGLVELGKSLLKFLLIFAVSVMLFNAFLDEFIGLGGEPVGQAVLHSVKLIGLCFLILSASLLLIVLVDAPYQLWDHGRRLRMTRQEVRDEIKETEGSPEVRGRIRRLQMETARKRMMDEVPKADVVVTNPTHFAVALRYDQTSASAPKVVAKGTDLIAAQIRNQAVAANVPLVAAPPLARALFYSTRLDQEIPQGLYLAVAQVLAYVYQLRTAESHGWEKPAPPGDLPVPNEFRKDV
ncbi:MAG: flagellar biosynthesis protein FlhB [Gammaproteobacteria bacterium]